MGSFELPPSEQSQLNPPVLDRAEKKSPRETQQSYLEEEYEDGYDNIINRTEYCESTIAYYVSEMSDSREAHGSRKWLSMSWDLAHDDVFGTVIDQWKESRQAQLFTQRPITGQYQERLRKYSNEDITCQRALFLEQLLDESAQIFGIQDEARREQEKEKILSEFWIAIYTRVKEMRIKALLDEREALETDLEQVRNGMIRFLQVKYPGMVSNAAIQRMQQVPVVLMDRYIAPEHLPTVGGTYRDDPPFIEIAGSIPAFGRKNQRTKSDLSHELFHAVSGHGQKLERAFTQIRRIEGEEKRLDCVGSARRVGVKRHDQRYLWLNEAITERLSGRFSNTPFKKQGYKTEQRALDILIEEHGIDENDLIRWYFSDGDSDDMEQEIFKKYPYLLQTLESVHSMVEVVDHPLMSISLKKAGLVGEKSMRQALKPKLNQ